MRDESPLHDYSVKPRYFPYSCSASNNCRHMTLLVLCGIICYLTVRIIHSKQIFRGDKSHFQSLLTRDTALPYPKYIRHDDVRHSPKAVLAYVGMGSGHSFKIEVPNQSCYRHSCPHRSPVYIRFVFIICFTTGEDYLKT
jgi:hypothetical protein